MDTVAKLVLTKFELCESECIDPAVLDFLVGEHVGMGHPPSAISAEREGGRELNKSMCVHAYM